MLPCEAILRAVDEDGRSDRQLSIAAVGHHSCISNLRRNRDIRISTASILCRELGLEFYIGPPKPVPVEIAKALGLPETCRTMDVVVEIARIARGS